MGKSKIEWTDRVWNPVVGCTPVTEGCRNCYAKRIHDMRNKACLEGKKLPEQYKKPFEEVQIIPDRLDVPLRWKNPQKVFVNSVSDLFHPDVPDKFIAKVFSIMWLTQQHTYIVLTKRPDRMKQLLNDEDFQFHTGWFASQAIRELGIKEPENLPYGWPNPNIWLGVSVSQKKDLWMIGHLIDTPAAVRLVSLEPLLEEISLVDYLPIAISDISGKIYHPAGGPFLDWVIAGGESGPNARFMHPDWVRTIKEECRISDRPFFFKQWGEWTTYDNDNIPCRIGKKAAGHLLDGIEYFGFPQVAK